jgi:thiosulfate reductase/polysulfide reductase chain A
MIEGPEIKRSICFWCNQRCRVFVQVKDNHLVEVKEQTEAPAGIFSKFWGTAIRGCPRRPAAKEIFYHPSRLNYPLKRKGDRGSGTWERISWDQAMGEIADRLAILKARYGAETLTTSRGTLRTTDEYRSRFMNPFPERQVQVPADMGQ